MAPRCSPRGDARSSPATNRPMSSLPRTATSKSTSAPIRMARDTKRSFAQVAHEILGGRFRQDQSLPRRHAAHALLDGDLGLALDGHGGGAVARASRILAKRAAHIGAWLLQADPASARDRRGQGHRGQRQRHAARSRAGLVSAAAEPAARCRHRRPRRHRRLSRGARQRHLHLCGACRRRRRRSADRHDRAA